MLPASDDKKNLIESMKKLSYYISNNATRQQQIFNSISNEDFTKILSHLDDQNEYLRRISALLICQLLYNNHSLKMKFAERLNIAINQGANRIVIGMNMKRVGRKNQNIPKCFELLKSKPNVKQQSLFCWAIHLDKKNLYIDLFEFKKYSSFTFLDPQTTIFGFTLNLNSNNFIQKQDPILPLNTTIDPKKDIKYIPSQSKTKRPSSAYQQIHRLSSSKDKIQTSYKFKDESPKAAKKQLLTQKKPEKSIYSISQYSKNTNSYKKQEQRMRQSISFNDELRYISRLNNSNKSHYSPKTAGMKQRTSMNESMGQESNRSNHENFYKRVQEILRK